MSVCPVSNQSWFSVKLLDFGDSRYEALETNSVHSSYSQRSSKENLCTTRNQAGLGALEFDDVISLLTSSRSAESWGSFDAKYFRAPE